MIRDAAHDKQVSEHIHHIIGFQTVARPQTQAFTRVFIDHRESADLRSVFQSLGHKVVRPYMVWPVWTQADTRSIIQIETAFLLMLLWNFKSLLAPDPLHSLMVDEPAFNSE